MRCAICEWKYPDHFLHQAFANGRYTPPLCGICALERSNKMHGVTRTEFQGEMAESMRLAAIDWRKKHPNDAPTKH